MEKSSKIHFAKGLKKSLYALFLMTFISWGAWLLVLFRLDPYESTPLALSFFYLSSAFALAGTFSIILFYLKRWRSLEEIYMKHLNISLRQGVILSLCTTICMALLMLGLLRIWNGLLVVVTITLVEFYFSGLDEYR